MKGKAKKGRRVGTLHEGRLVPITDPAIQAALDELRRMKNPVVPPILLEHARQRLRREAERERANRKTKKSRS
jgi:hypothetical protein